MIAMFLLSYMACLAVPTVAFIASPCASGTLRLNPSAPAVAALSAESSEEEGAAPMLLSRRTFGAFLSPPFAAAVFGAALPANADIDVSSLPTATSSATTASPSSSLRSVKRSLKQLGSLEFYAAQNDYAALKSALREPPVSEVRRNANGLIKEAGGATKGEDFDTSYGEELKDKYQKFIKNLEDLDGRASLGMRGRKNVELAGSYDSTMTSLREFIEAAEQGLGDKAS